ncbi:MAG TPA: contractile injection system protein, VgrG/Pvc8 family [Longimicrobiaceae bacterium]|nr:contractile injection system protein, VgrG/Pvc8 family [Longimicrobiaceae bacterium]
MSKPDKYLAPAFKVEVDGAELEADVRLYVQELWAACESDGTDSCSVTLVNPYPEMPWTHGEHKDVFAIGSEVKLLMGYVDKVQAVFDGEVTALAPTFPADGIPRLTIVGHSKLHRLTAPSRTDTYLGVTDADIVTRIAGRAGLTGAADSPGVTYDYVMQNNLNDLAFLRRRARRMRFEVWVEGSKLHFGKPRDTGSKEMTLVWGRTANAFAPPDELVPLYEFHPVADAQGQVSGVKVRWWDMAKGEAVEGAAAAGDVEAMGGTSGPAAADDSFGTERTLVVTDEPVAAKADADLLAAAILNERAMGYVRARGSSIGLPALKPGQVVAIDGVGDAFSGSYYVSRVVHRMDGEGFSTDFEVRRNALT